MSRLNRKDFKNLLTEWNQNFINERFSDKIQPKLQNIVKTRFPIKVVCINNGFELKKMLIEKNITVEDTGAGTSYFEKNKNNNNVLTLLANENKINFSSDEEIILLFQSFKDDNPTIIVDTSTGDQVYSNVDNKLESVIPWVFHDIYHDVLESHLVARNRYVEDNPFSTNPEYLESFYGDYREFEKSELETKEITSEYIPLDEEDLTEEMVRFFTKINFTPFVGNHDIPASIFSFCVTKLASVDEIDNLELSEKTKKLLKKFYYDSQTAIESVIKSYKNKFILFHRNNENEFTA